MKLGLDNVREFAESIGSPQNAFPTAHVAGTNGKGSTVMMLGAVLREAGYKTGVFTSPHLMDFRERIRINGTMIDKRFVTRWIERHKAEIIRRQITYFEVMVALAVSYFKSRNVDIAVIETGLGGRLDATNILAPNLTIITEISLDHVSILGDTLSKIAGEKAGIIKHRTPLIIGEMPAAARRKLESVARKRSAPLIRLASASRARRSASALALRGPHQIQNARNVLSAVGILNNQGFEISESALAHGLANVRWAGRFQSLRSISGASIIVDVAHNETGVAALVATYKERFANQKATVVVGFVRNKDHRPLFAALSGIAAEFILTQLPTHRSVEPEEFLRYLKGFAGKTTIRKSPAAAFKLALSGASSRQPILVVGSHYLAGEFLRAKPHKR